MAPAGIIPRALLFFLLGTVVSSSAPYYGTRIGKFSTHFHDVRGEVFAVDDKTLFIKNFNFDGMGPDSFFWAGKSIRPDTTGFVIADENASKESLKAYRSKDFILRLPDDENVKDIRWLSVWSKKFRANFGSLIFPKSLEPPRPFVIGPFQNTQRGVSSGEILILDTQTFLVPDFSYDGTGKGVYWWLSRGMKPNVGGLRLRDENGSDAPLQEYKNQIVVITLPDGHSVYDYNILSVWSSVEIDDYGSVGIPSDILVPPSPRTLGIATENKLNCEMLNDNLGLEARWMISGDQIIMQLVGKIDETEYMALGFSKDDTETKFESADSVVAWVGPDGRGNAVDFFLGSAEKCENGQGMCPDTVYERSDDITMLNAVKVDDVNVITFKRPLKADDKQYDQNIYTDGPQAVLWAVGPLLPGGLPGPPKIRTKGNLLLDFGRDPIWNCPPPNEKTLTSNKISNKVPEINCPSDLTFRAQMGPPTGQDVDRVWFINGIPTPTLTVQRGKTYTFIVEGGMSPPRHHPLYITSSKEGGLYRTILEEEDISEELFAGVQRDSLTGYYLPTAEGRLCDWSISERDPEHSVTTSTDNFFPPLVLSCGPGHAGKLLWTPDSNTSDTVYYQSFTEKNIGGRIRVVDFCEETNPNHYLEEENQHRVKTSETTHHDSKQELEREDYAFGSNGNVNEGTSVPPVATVPAADSKQQNNAAFQNDPITIDSDGNPKMDLKLVSVEERVINGFSGVKGGMGHKTSSEGNSHIAGIGGNMNRNNFSLSESSFHPEASESIPETTLHPHDESERSDKNIPEPASEQALHGDISRHEKISVGSHNHFDIKHKPQRYMQSSTNAHSNVLSKITQPPPGFKPQFEGGFIPLVLNSAKEKELNSQKDFVLPPPHLRRPHRPFLFNESIPFHGTFKPGVPDFSGFNISHYAQDDSSYPANHVSDHLPLLTAPKPQLMQRPLSPMGGLPPELFQRPQGAFPRPQMIGYGPRPQIPGFGGQHRPVFAQLPSKHRPNFGISNSNEEDLLAKLPSKHRPNFGISNSNDEDLAEVSSQRVQISLQTSGEDKGKRNNPPGMPIIHGPSRKRPQGLQPNKMMPPPPIQRRPDFVEEDDGSSNPSRRKPPHNNPHQNFPSNFNKNAEQQRFPPHMQQGRPRGPFPFRRPQPGGNSQLNDRLVRNWPPRPPPPKPQRPLQTLIQRPMNGRPPHFPNMPKENIYRYRVPDKQEITLPELTSEEIAIISEDQSLVDYSISEGHPDIQINKRPGNNLKGEEAATLNSNEQLAPPVLINRDLITTSNPIGHRPLILMRPPPGVKSELPVKDQQPPIRAETFYIKNTAELTHEQQPIRLHEHKPYFKGHSSPPYQKPNEVLSSTDATFTSQEHDSADEIRTHIQNHKKTVTENTSVVFDQPKYNKEIPQSFFNEQEAEETSEFSAEEANDEEEIEIHSNINPFSLPNYDIAHIATHVPDSDIKDLLLNQKETVTRVINGGHVVHETADYDVPFGARLKVRQGYEPTGGKPNYQMGQRPNPHPRQPQFRPPPFEESSYLPTSTNMPKVHSQKNSAELYIKLPIQGSGKQQEVGQKHENSTNSQSLSAGSNQHSATNYIETKIQPASNSDTHVPSSVQPERPEKNISQSDSEKLSLQNPGRKHILTTNTEVKSAPHIIPHTAPEDLNLPHILESQPTHDNGTDYSILNHVLALIGSQSQPKSIASPREANS